MTKEQAIIGTRVRSLVEFAGIPKGTEGVIDAIEVMGLADETDAVVAWDLPDNPLPPGYKEFDGKPTIQTGILRDWFEDEALKYLEVVQPAQPQQGAFTLVEVMMCVAIVAILGALIYGSAVRHRAQKQGVKVEQEAKPFERFTVTYQRTPAGNPDLWLFHDNIDGSDVLYISRRSGDGTAVVLPKPLRSEPGYGLTVTNVRPWTERP